MSEVKKIKPSLSKGTRDFLPAEVAKRNYIFDTIKNVFRKYGFEQIETPAIERLETLTGKYGEEGDKLLFKILNSGDYLTEIRNQKSEINLTPQEVTPMISEKGLRYDLTVPLARYVVQHQDDLAFPFKRFHIGPVWRADRPQKGRYQEFYQCDADVIGSASLLNEVELTKIYAEVFSKLGLNVTIKVNSRKILQGIADYCGCSDKLEEITVSIDKLDKIGVDGVKADLISKDIDEEKIQDIFSCIFPSPDDYVFFTKEELISEQEYSEEEALNQIELYKTGLHKDYGILNCLWEYFFRHYNNVQGIGETGLMELQKILDAFALEKQNGTTLSFSPSLARGLNYYTGIIWEVACNDVKIGSIASGGRYDNLTEMFGGQNMSGVGISFGIERIYDVMEELNLFPDTISQGVKVLFVPRDAGAEEFTFQQTQTLRDAGIGAEIFLGNVKKQKQFNYAEQKNIAYIVEVGGDEIQSKKFRLRNAKTRDTETDLSIEQIIAKVQ